MDDKLRDFLMRELNNHTGATTNRRVLEFLISMLTGMTPADDIDLTEPRLEAEQIARCLSRYVERIRDLYLPVFETGQRVWVLRELGDSDRTSKEGTVVRVHPTNKVVEVQYPSGATEQLKVQTVFGTYVYASHAEALTGDEKMLKRWRTGYN